MPSCPNISIFFFGGTGAECADYYTRPHTMRRAAKHRIYQTLHHHIPTMWAIQIRWSMSVHVRFNSRYYATHRCTNPRHSNKHTSSQYTACTSRQPLAIALNALFFMLMQTALTVVTVSPFFNKSLAHICICVAPACSLSPNPAFLYTNFLCEGPVVRLNVLCVRANRVVCTPGESSRAQPGLFPGSILFLFSFHSRCLVFLFC